MGLVGCYSVHLYCDANHENDRWQQVRYDWTPAEFTGETQAECIRKARAVGWFINLSRDDGDQGLGYCLCPDHYGKVLDRFGGTT